MSDVRIHFADGSTIDIPDDMIDGRPLILADGTLTVRVRWEHVDTGEEMTDEVVYVGVERIEA